MHIYTHMYIYTCNHRPDLPEHEIVVAGEEPVELLEPVHLLFVLFVYFFVCFGGACRSILSGGGVFFCYPTNQSTDR